MRHQHTKLGSKHFSGSAVQEVIRWGMTEILNSHCGLKLEDSIQNFSHDTVAYQGALAFRVWWQKFQHLRNCEVDKNKAIS